jgi:hypothetical protein
MARVEVDGGWVDIRDPRKLTGRQSEPMDDAQFALMGMPGMAALIPDDAAAEQVQNLTPAQQMAALGAEGLKAMRTLQRATVMAYVEAWSEGAKPDGTPGITEDMLLDAPAVFVTAVENAITVVVKATGRAAVNTEPNPDPASPTSPLSA